MALGRVKKLELISAKDTALISMDPLVIAEGENPYVFVFKPPTDISIRSEYLLNLVEIQQLFPKSDGSDVPELISKLSLKEQVDFMEKSASIQFKIVDLLLVGYKEKIDGELIEKNNEIMEVMKENDVIGEFFNKIINIKTDLNDKKKS